MFNTSLHFMFMYRQYYVGLTGGRISRSSV